jgi:hypothetical protein
MNRRSFLKSALAAVAASVAAAKGLKGASWLDTPADDATEQSLLDTLLRAVEELRTQYGDLDDAAFVVHPKVIEQLRKEAFLIARGRWTVRDLQAPGQWVSIAGIPVHSSRWVEEGKVYFVLERNIHAEPLRFGQGEIVWRTDLHAPEGRVRGASV